MRAGCRGVTLIVVLACAAACAREELVVVPAPAEVPVPSPPPDEATGPVPPSVVASQGEPQRKPRSVPNGKDAFPAAAAACDWLARHQSADGGWSLRSPGGGCGDARCSEGEGPPDVVGDTSLALLAFLSTHQDLDSSRLGVALKSGLARLVSAQAPDGSFEVALAPHRVLDQALATEAFCWVLNGTSRPRAANDLCRSAAERALAHLLILRTPGAAWSDGAVGSPDDLRVTTWATMAVVEARMAGFDVPPDVTRDVLAWLDTDPGGRGQAAAAMRTCCRLFLGTTQRDPHLVADHAILLDYDADPDRDGKAADALGRYFVTVAESRWGGEPWARRRTSRNGALLPLQRGEGDGCVCGSWDPDGARGPEGDRIGTTALTAMLYDAVFISTYANGMRAREPQIPK